MHILTVGCAINSCLYDTAIYVLLKSPPAGKVPPGNIHPGNIIFYNHMCYLHGKFDYPDITYLIASWWGKFDNLPSHATIFLHVELAFQIVCCMLMI